MISSVVLMVKIHHKLLSTVYCIKLNYHMCCTGVYKGYLDTSCC